MNELRDKRVTKLEAELKLHRERTCFCESYYQHTCSRCKDIVKMHIAIYEAKNEP